MISEDCGFYLVHFGPEAMFETFLGLIERLRVFEGVQVCENSHDSRETMDLTDVEEFKSLHLKAKTSVDQHQDLVKAKELNCQLKVFSIYRVSLDTLTKSATFAKSIMVLISLLHSIKVRRRFFPVVKCDIIKPNDIHIK